MRDWDVPRLPVGVVHQQRRLAAEEPVPVGSTCQFYKLDDPPDPESERPAGLASRFYELEADHLGTEEIEEGFELKTEGEAERLLCGSKTPQERGTGVRVATLCGEMHDGSDTVQVEGEAETPLRLGAMQEDAAGAGRPHSWGV